MSEQTDKTLDEMLDHAKVTIDAIPDEPTAYHRKLAEACADRIDEKYGLSLSAVVRSLMSAVLASEGVVDPFYGKQLLQEIADMEVKASELQVEVERLEAAAKQMHAQISRLQSLCSSTGTGRPFFPG